MSSLIFTDVVDVPVTVKVGPEEKQETFEFPVLPSTQIIKTCAGLRTERIASIVKQCKEFAVPSQQAAYMVFKEETRDIDPMDAHNYFMTPTGVDECLTLSLKLNNPAPNDVEIQRILSKFVLDDRRTIAIRVAKIFKPKTPTKPNIAGTSTKSKRDGIGFEDQQQPNPLQAAAADLAAVASQP